MTDRPPAKRADAARNRQRILDAARTAFAATGAETSMAEIARRSGVGQATLYRNFAARHELLEALLVDEVDEVCAAAATVAGDSPGERLTAWLRRFFQYVTTKRPVVIGLLEHTDRTDPVFDSRGRMLAAGRCSPPPGTRTRSPATSTSTRSSTSWWPSRRSPVPRNTGSRSSTRHSPDCAGTAPDAHAVRGTPTGSAGSPRVRLQGCVQVAYREGDVRGRVERLVVPAGDLPVIEQAREVGDVLLARAGRQHRILRGIEHDRGHATRCRKPAGEPRRVRAAYEPRTNGYRSPGRRRKAGWPVSGRTMRKWRSVVKMASVR
jgi:AcrR family transcriptional regulator